MPKRQPDPNEPTRIMGPEPGRTTDPMPQSPYQGGVPVPPPPPPYNPPPVYTPAPPPPSSYGTISGLSPTTPPRGNRGGGGFIGGIIAALLIVVAIGVGIAAYSGAFGSAPAKGTTIAQGQPTTTQPQPTVAATGTAPAPTVAPTDVPSPTATTSPNPTATTAPTPSTSHTLPPPPPGFTNYLPQNDDWGLNYPIGTQIYALNGTLPSTGENVPAVVFALQQSATFTVYDLPTAVSPDQAQTIFNALAAQLHAQDVHILDQGTVQLGANTWQEIHLRATINGQREEGYILYTPHGTGANALSMVAPQGATFTTVNTTDFQPMIDSFTYLS